MKCNNNLYKDLTRRQLLKYGIFGTVTAGISSSLWLAGCSKSRRAKKPNVILISIDTLRRDHCSAYGYLRNTTPNLSKFAQQSTSFDLAYSPTSTTGPTHASIFTGLYPIAHHVFKNGLQLSAKHKTLAEIFGAKGYQVAGIISSFVLNSKFGYAQGFTHYDDKFKTSQSTMNVGEWEGFELTEPFDRRADFTTNRAICWLKNHHNSNQPFFLFIHYFDPHNPYTPPENFARQFVPINAPVNSLRNYIGRYDAEIAFTDQEVGVLLSELKKMELEENTLVVILSDHGEGLMDHGHLCHGVHIYEEAVRVPLLFRWPNHIPSGRVVKEPVGLISVAPTILELTNIKADNQLFQAQSLAGSLLSKTKNISEQSIYLYRRHYEEGEIGRIWIKGEKFGVRTGPWKYIEGKEEKTKELFNLETDPKERTNLCSKFPDKTAELVSRLKKWKQEHMTKITDPGTIPKADLERLKTLGYVE